MSRWMRSARLCGSWGRRWADAVAVTVAVKRPFRAKQMGHLCWSVVVVRGGVEPPTFRFSGGLASPDESTTGRVTRPYNALAALGVHDQPHVSTVVVSTALAGSAAMVMAWSGRTLHGPATGLKD